MIILTQDGIYTNLNLFWWKQFRVLDGRVVIQDSTEEHSLVLGGSSDNANALFSALNESILADHPRFDVAKWIAQHEEPVL